MSVKPYHIIAAAVLSVFAASCAKGSSEDSAAASKRAFDAWMYVHYPGVDPTGYGIYIISDTPGDGDEVADSNYIFLEYEKRKAEDGTLVSYTSESLAKQMGTYSISSDYGPAIIPFAKGNVSQGVIDLLTGGGRYGRMRTGGSRTAVIPGWLTSTSSYYDSGNAEDYIKNVSGDNCIYSITLAGQVKDITKWQTGLIEEYMKARGIPAEDTTGHYGFYYSRDREREAQRGVTVQEDVKFQDDTTIYINYTGRLLNGRVFDTSIEDTAKVWNIYSSGSSYGPVAVTWNADSTQIKLSGSSVIPGFMRILWRMHPYESGTGLFISDYGYGTSGSGSTIKGYTPLSFEIDIVDKTAN